MGSGFALLCLLCATLCLLLAGAASAQFEIGAVGGAFFPSDGNAGPSAHVQIGGRFSDRWRLAAEVSYRDHENELFGLDDVDIQSIGLGLIVNYIFLPDAFLTPYVGVGLGLGVNLLDDDAIERHLLATTPGATDADVTPVSVSIGALGLVGLQAPPATTFRSSERGASAATGSSQPSRKRPSSARRIRRRMSRIWVAPVRSQASGSSSDASSEPSIRSALGLCSLRSSSTVKPAARSSSTSRWAIQTVGSD
jgi:hypothetical protein